jgi:hypothetical protein
MIARTAEVMDQRPQSSSASRVTAGAFGFLSLSQSGERPRRYAADGFAFLPIVPFSWTAFVGLPNRAVK